MQGSEDMATVGQVRRPAGAPGASERGVGPRLAATTTFGANPGALRMLSYAPTGLEPKSPLVVVLHGCAQNARDNAAGAGWLQLADRLGFAVLVPEQAAANNPNRCFNWFVAGDTRRGQGECASIAEMIGVMIKSHDLDGARMFITGLSAGGAMTAAMLATYPELFAGGAIIAGLPYGVARGMQEAMRAMRGLDSHDGAALAALVVDASGGPPRRPFRLSIWHGDEDPVVAPSNAHALVRQWTLATDALQILGKDQVSERLVRARWGDARQGGALIELNLVRGLGHGTPLSTKRPGDVGSPAPFLVECGVSSTLEIARFWRLDARASAHAATRIDSPRPAAPPSKPPEPAVSGQAPETSPANVAAHVLGSIERHVPKEIHDVIARSLRAAGLMK